MRTYDEQTRFAAIPERAGMSWRDLVQSVAHDVADMPVLARLLAGQAVLALGGVTLGGLLVLRERSQSRLMPTLLVGSLTVGAGGAFIWGVLALASRVRSVPAMTALFTYGEAAGDYLPLRRSLAPAA